jgi:hypothetical protein
VYNYKKLKHDINRQGTYENVKSYLRLGSHGNLKDEKQRLLKR